MDCKKIASGALRKRILRIMIIPLVFIIIVSMYKYREGAINYHNADATWHTLLTMEAYDETPAAIHHFVPIVSLGEEDDKWIPWGSTIFDAYGNSYYTSFSSAGFALPYFFVKIMHLPISEKSLYLFNTLLFIISAILWVYLINKVYNKSKHIFWISMVALITYTLSPELLHGMGIVYWHQSLMQVTLLLQIIAYYSMKTEKSKFAKVLFYILTLCNPYIEWTGYVANAGFALAEFIFYRKQLKKALGQVLIIGLLTVMSFGIFIIHYLSVIDWENLIFALKNRFLTRSFSSSTSITDVFDGYLKSFLYLWLLMLFMAVWSFIRDRKVELRHGTLILVMTFLVLENIIMKQHAAVFTYDRMKLVFVLSFVLCELSYNILKNAKNQKLTIVVLMGVTFFAGLLNLNSYKNDDNYIWEADYRTSNEVLATYIDKTYADSVIAISGYDIRGYMNLLFGRGIFEYIPEDRAIEIANDKGKEYVVMLNLHEKGKAKVYFLGGATVYNRLTGETVEVTVSNDTINTTEISKDDD